MEAQIENLNKLVKLWRDTATKKTQEIKLLKDEIELLKSYVGGSVFENAPQVKDEEIENAQVKLIQENDQLKQSIKELLDQCTKQDDDLKQAHLQLQASNKMVQKLEQKRANNQSNQVIQDLKQKLEKIESGDAESLAQQTFTVLNPVQMIRKRITYMSYQHEWISLGDHLQQKPNAGFTVSPALDTYMEQRQNYQQIKGLQTDEAPEILQAQLETIFFGPIDVQEYSSATLVDQEVSKHIKSIQNMLVTELICLQNIRANSEKQSKEGEIMNDFQKRVIGRMMRRTLNQIPAYKLGSKKPVKDFEVQKQNLSQLLHMRTIQNMAFTQAKGQTNASNDIQFAENIFKYINEYDTYISQLKNPQKDQYEANGQIYMESEN